MNAAITRGAAFLEKLQRPDGGWIEYDSQPGGVTALCTLALLNCGRNAKEHESVRKALLYLEKQSDPDRTYNASLMIMAFAQADAKKYSPTIKKLAIALASRQMRDDLIPRFVRIPAREFAMGSNDGADDERPAHRVQVDAFFASVHPITVEQYAEFTRETGHGAPGIRDLPTTMENLTVENFQSNGPFGAKGVGEVATFCVAPAIANAIDDAVGVRLTELPLNPETVFRAIRAKAGRPLDEA